MADELTISASLAFLKGSFADDLSVSGLQFTVSGTKFIHNIQSVGFAAEEAILLGDVATPGFAIFINRDATNFVTIRGATGLAGTIKLKAGEPAMFRFSGTAPFIIADTAACNVEYLIIEN